ncbi:ribosome maturation factor RimM [Jiella sp. M17.18]|uniref:ribosome maturation factor RimM n=1 Tax=Jiella sp. M17.18 TaxID=3234247 RepID=UPI0034E017EE
MSSPPFKPDHPVLLAVIGGAHGIRGECRVRSFTEDPLAIGAYGPLFDEGGNRYTVKAVRPQKAMLLVRFAEVADRNHAERLNGTELFVERAALPEPEEDDEFYLDDLIGLAVETVAGETVGTVVGVHNFGAGDILEVGPEGGRTVMIPFSEAAVPTIDAERGVLVVEPGAAGLSDAEPEEGEDEAEEATGGGDA